MAKEVTKAQLRELIQNALDEGLDTKEMAQRFNEQYGDEKNKLSAADVTRLKELVGLKGAKPRKKNQVFRIVENLPERTDPHVTPIAEEEFPTEEDPLPFKDLEKPEEEVVDQF